MQRDGEGLQEQQSMEQKHDYVRTINLFMGSRHETLSAHTLVLHSQAARVWLAT